MAMKLSYGTPVYDNYEEWEDAHAEWCHDGAQLSYEKEMHTPESYRKLMDEHMAVQPAMTQETWEKHQAWEDNDCPVPF